MRSTNNGNPKMDAIPNASSLFSWGISINTFTPTTTQQILCTSSVLARGLHSKYPPTTSSHPFVPFQGLDLGHNAPYLLFEIQHLRIRHLHEVRRQDVRNVRLDRLLCQRHTTLDFHFAALGRKRVDREI